MMRYLYLKEFLIAGALTLISVPIKAQRHLAPSEFPSKNQGAIVCYPASTILDTNSIGGFVIVEKMPLFPGCDEIDSNNDQKYECSQKKLLEYLNHNLRYPPEAKAAGIEGDVAIQFIVGTSGEITNAKCTQDIGAGCGTEALRLINSMNDLPEKWTPAEQLGKPVAIQYSLAISFKL